MELECIGSEEFQKKLEDAIRKFPDRAEERLESLGKDFKKRAIENTNKAVIAHTRKKSINKGYKVSKVIGYGVNMETQFKGTAKHFHLVEKGHIQEDRKGNAIRFIEGRHMVEKTRNEFEHIIPLALNDIIQEIVEECKLK